MSHFLFAVSQERSFSVLGVLTAARSKCETTRRRAGMKTRAEDVTIACPPGGPSDVACTPRAASGGAGSRQVMEQLQQGSHQTSHFYLSLRIKSESGRRRRREGGGGEVGRRGGGFQDPSSMLLCRSPGAITMTM